MQAPRLRLLVVHLCLVALAVVAAVRVVPTTRDLLDAYDANGAGDTQAAADRVRANTDLRYVEWLRRKLPPEGTYALWPRAAETDGALVQWLTYQLLPRVDVPDPARADAVLVHGARAPLPRGFRTAAVFAPGYALALRERAP